MSRPDPRPAPKTRRRPGRARRWLLRPLLWAAALVAIASLALSLVVESRWAEERARQLLVSYLETKLGAAVELESLSFEVVPLGVELRGLVIGSGGSDTLPMAVVPRAAVSADLEAFFRPSLRLRRVVVEEPQVSLRWLEMGGDNLVRWRRSGDPGRRVPVPLAVSVDVVELTRGSLLLEDQKIPFELTARRLDARLAGRRDGALEGYLRSAEVTTQLARGRPHVDRLSVWLRLQRGRVEFRDGRIAAPGLDAAFEGAYRWGDARELTVDLTADARAELVNRWDLSSLTAGGLLELEGGFAWRPQLWGFRGTVASQRLDFLERSFADVVAVVSLDRNGGRVDLEAARYGDGRLSGEITVGRGEEGRPVVVDLDLDGVRLSRLLDDQGLPIRGVEARVSGGFDYRFPAAASLLGDGFADLSVAAEAEPAAGVMTLAGRVMLEIDRGVVRPRASRLTSPTQELTARGAYRLETSSGRFEYEIVTADLPPLLALLPGLAEATPPPLWLPVTGRGRLDGVLTLSPGQVTTDLRLDLAALDAPGYTAEAAVGSLTATPEAVERLRIELLRPAGALLVVGGVSFAEAGTVDLSVESEGWPLEDLRVWLPVPAPAGGRVSGRLELAGPPEALTGSVVARVGPLAVAGIETGELTLVTRFAGGVTEVSRATVATEAGAVRLAGRVAAEEVDLTIDSDALDLTAPPLAGLTGGRLTGRASLSGRIGGTPESPSLELEIAGRDLAVGERTLPASSAELVWRDGRIEVDGSLLGLAELAGGGPAGDAGLAVELTVATDRLAELAAIALADPAGLTGSASGRLRLEAGPAFADPRARLTLDQLELEIADRRLTALEPVQIEAGGDGLRIVSLWLGEAEATSELFLAGRVGAGPAAELDLTAQASLGSQWLAPLVPDLELRGGRLDAIGRVTGSTAAPAFNGIGTLSGVDALLEGLPSSFEAASGVILFDPGQWVIDRAEAGFGGGRLRLGGTIDFEDGWLEPSYRLRLAAETVNVRYPEGWLLRGDATATIASIPTGRVVSGRVDLERATYSRPVDLGLATLLRTLTDRQRVEVEESREFLAETEINLEVRGPGALVVRNNVADLRGSADLSIRGSLARPVLFGRVELNPGGTIDFSGTEYEIERGLLTFANPYRIEPVIDLVARTELRDYDVVLNLSGPPERLQVTFDSDPPLADLEVLSLVTSGGVWSPSEARGTAGAEGFLYGQAASLLTSRANQLFGLDKLQIDPLTAESGDLSSVRVTLSERLSSDLTATYSYDPSTTEEEILELRWSVNRQLTTVVTQNGDGSYSVDLLWERSF